MRSILAGAVVLAGLGVAVAAEPGPLPGYFHASWAAVRAAPLVIFNPASTASPAKAPLSTPRATRSLVASAPPEAIQDPVPVKVSAPARTASNDRTEPFSLNVPASLRIRDEQSFVIGGDHYRLASLTGLVDDKCEKEAGGRCIRHPRKALKQGIAGATLRCRSMVSDGAVKTLIDCQK